MLLGKKSVSFKLDTGAEVTAISEETFRELGHVKLELPNKVLYGPARQTLDVLGQFSITIQHQGNSSLQTIFVVRGLKTNLLGLPAIAPLHLLRRVSDVHSEGDDLREQFPKVFTGLGKLGDEYFIKLKEGAIPYSLYIYVAFLR